MQFLSDLYVTCPECEGKRYTPEALEIELEGRNIHQVLTMTVTEAIEFFFKIDNRKAQNVVEGLNYSPTSAWATETRPTSQHTERRGKPAPQARRPPARQTEAG